MYGVIDKKLTVGVFFGSRSPEHDISIVTGQLIISGLRGLGLRVLPIYLDKKGEWMIGEPLGSLKVFTADKPAFLDPVLGHYELDLKASRGRLVFLRKGFWHKRKIVDVAFPAFHGSFGEDGTIQGLFEMFGIPYVGCDVPSSAVTIDKIRTKQFFQALAVPTTKFAAFDYPEWQKERKKVLQKIQADFKFPLFIKPARLGSSIAVSKVKSASELEDAVELALHYDDRFLAEEAVENLKDITCAVLGGDEPVASFLQESSFDRDFLSYHYKYLPAGGSQLGKGASVVIPADLPEAQTAELRSLSVRIFKAFGCWGISRVDFLYDKKS